jgi:hypothetical protein
LLGGAEELGVILIIEVVIEEFFSDALNMIGKSGHP